MPKDREQGHLCIGYLNLRLNKYCTNFGDGRLHIFFEASKSNDYFHEKFFAMTSKSTDLGRSIAIHITDDPDNPVQIDFWPQSSGYAAVAEANKVAEALLR